MKSIEKIENMIEKWFKPLPHLPSSASRWIAKNIWWIVAIGAVLSIIGTLVMIGTIFTAISLLGTTTSLTGYYIAPAYTGWSVAELVISLLFMIATVALLIMAVNPLKFAQKRGWSLLFLILILRAVATVVSAIFTYTWMGFIDGIIMAVIGVAINAYLLNEIHSYFSKK